MLIALGCQSPVLATPLIDLDREALTDTSKVIDLDEVTIVAQPKEQVRLRLQPVSSNVFGAEQLQQLNVHDLSQLSQYVPSFVMPSYGSRLTSSMYIRGIGSRVNSPAVGIYYDKSTLLYLCLQVQFIGAITYLREVVIPCHLFHHVDGQHLHGMGVKLQGFEYLFETKCLARMGLKQSL